MHGQGLSNTSPTGLPFSLPFFAKIRVRRALDLIAAQSIIPYFQYPGLSAYGKTDHKVFTRKGGRSLPPYHSFNTSLAVHDRPESVTYHLEQIRSLMGAESLVFMNQTHGDQVAAVERRSAGDAVPDADAMITGDPGVAIMVKQADCQAVMLVDPVKRVVANVHCGWRGNVQNILGKTVKEMVRSFGCRAGDVKAAISPSLGPCCAQYRTHEEIFPKSFLQFRVGDDHFDLRAVSCWQLVEAGILPENIEVADVCTSCRTDLFYSYRREGETGRFASVVMVKR
jgi:hypothetical protein